MSDKNSQGITMGVNPSTPKEIMHRFDKILKDNDSIESIEHLLSGCLFDTNFILPYLKAIFYKHHEKMEEAAKQMDSAISMLKAGHLDSIMLNNSMTIDLELYSTIYVPHIKKLWGQAGEIYANVNRLDDAVEAYKKYQMHHICIKGDDISNGLYSFRRINIHTINDLISNTITVSAPHTMNDPYDTLLLSWGNYHKENKQNRKHIDSYVKSMNYFRIRSFTKVESNILSNVLMWAHYADEHKGMCVEYHFSDDFEKTTDAHICRFRNIIYHAPEKTIALNVDAVNTDLSLLTKLDSWDYENEVRLISYMPSHEEQYVPIELDLNSYIKNIYFGMRCSSHDIKLITKIMEGKNVNFYQLKPNYNDIFHPKIIKL